MRTPVLAAWVLTGAAAAFSQTSKWTSCARYVRDCRYASLNKINASKVSKLETGWRLETDQLGRPECKLEGNRQ